MDTNDAIAAFSALAQPTRLETFKLLVGEQPEGVAAGELARLIGVPQNTMSAHLAVLTRAGLIEGERDGRSIAYKADFAGLQRLMLFLLKNCCNGRPEICAPLIAELSPCCKPLQEIPS
ncbi:ArsR/SmtB family transcription factor [Mesorhizobium sp. ZC-5]|uniref:ArsR/SmtB family transcription factor n=1 Tax=Mesorhizobium sp. ZC-5 TaxID=2986066 RepID=UPI0021E6E1C8|nr:helix-turn-helix transcriptional regulator [Mesorhizobium sp. ZC-5]MCV3239771.1 ArsR family transcriptional regulator [Mesorhizobium sp. ZC-5]